MHFLGASRDGPVARRVDLDTISSSDMIQGSKIFAELEVPTRGSHTLDMMTMDKFSHLSHVIVVCK
jgi:hypothetical protein